MTEQFIIKRRPGWETLGNVTVTIECDPLASHPVKLGLAVRAALKARAYLGGADLGGADLRGADLRGADLTDAYLMGADLGGAYLTDAALRGVDLTDAALRGVDLTDADLVGADLEGADLGGAYLGGERIARIFARVQREIDPYAFMAVELEAGGYKIAAGCRWFTDAEFRAHVAAKYPGTGKAIETLAILDFIAARARALEVEADHG